jgi:hypothetical protein
VDCVEPRWWFGISRPGDRTMRATYDAETLGLAWVTDMEATGPAMVHGIDCAEVRVEEWSAETGRKMNNLVFYARAEEDAESRWVAVVSEEGGMRVLFTLVDEHFESQWGASANPARKLYDDGRYRLRPDGSYETTDGTGLEAGTYDVTVGGRTVLRRQYGGRFHYKKVDQLRRYPNHPRLTIDGNVYVQCDCTGRAHDDVTDTALGVLVQGRSAGHGNALLCLFNVDPLVSARDRAWYHR